MSFPSIALAELDVMLEMCCGKRERKKCPSRWSHWVDGPFYVEPDAKKRVWSYMTLNVLTQTKCHKATQNSKRKLFCRA